MMMSLNVNQATEDNFKRRIEVVRSFNRFFTKQIGVLHEGLLESRFSLAEVRVLYELAHRRSPTAREIASELNLDAGYLSRILRCFEEHGLLSRTPSGIDGRQSHLGLTKKGQKVFAPLNARASDEIAALLGKLSSAEQNRLVAAMQTIERLLSSQPVSKTPYLLRQHQPGDMGWVVYQHGVLYAREYGWDEQFEALVAEITARFIQNFDPKRERCWIAEIDGENVGSVFLVKKSETVAQLRLLLVDPKARGHGIGKRLVSECERFARQAGYRKIVLWTNSVLDASRHIYEEAGYRLIQEAPHHKFGHDLVGQTWELEL
jgi:DNA-binding MarR family transcriptional regulator/GNAT superfamily N-acetyltransferase